jgi:hypothetical protein
MEYMYIDQQPFHRFMELVWAKLSLQQRIHKLGYNYLYTVCWLAAYPCLKLFSRMHVS